MVVVVVSTAVVVSMGVSLVAVSTGEAFVVAVSMGDVSAVAVSTAVAFVVAVLVAATSVAIFAITDFLMMSSSATSAFRGGGAIRTDITVTTRTITMDTATMDTAGTGTTVAPGTVTTMVPVMDTAMAADQGICGGCGVGDKRGLRLLEFDLLLVRLDTLTNCFENGLVNFLSRDCDAGSGSRLGRCTNSIRSDVA